MRLRAIFICLVLGLATSGTIATSQEEALKRSDLIELMGKIPEMSRVRERLEKQGYTGRKLDLAVDHETRLMNDKVVAGYFADRLIALYNGNLPPGWAPDGLIGPLFEAGYTNLPRREQVFYFQVQRSLLQAMETRDCGLLMKGRMTERRLERVLGSAESRLSADTLKRYYQLQRTAIRTGVSRAPRKLSPADSARIQERLNMALRARIEGDESLASVGAAFENMNRASAAQACQAGIVFYETALSLKGRELEHVLLYLNE